MSVRTMKLKINNTVKQDEKVSIPPKRKNLKFKINAQPSTPKSTIKLSLNTKSSNNVSNSSDEYRVTADEYSRYSQKDHIYNITDSYCGSDEKTERIVRALDIENMKILEKEITLPQAVENIFVEISSNAGDNVARAIKNNRDPGEVFIEMTKKRITVRNGGAPIPIEINTKENMWAPEMIFGTLLTSSNYDKTKVRTECGRNGYGAKLTNIFSNFFQVTVGDPFNQKHYKQIWRDNMSIKEDPVITNFSPKSKAFVEVTYEMDFERFGYTEFPDEAFELFARHAADMSFTQKVPVTFNGHRFNIRKAEEYAKLSVVDGQINNHIVYYEWYPGMETFNKRGVNYARDKNAVPKTEICVVDTPDKGMIVSFVNGKWTHNNGVHADAAFKAISHDLLELVNNTGKKGKKKKRSQKLYVSDVKKHVTIIVNCWIEDPKFDSQYKTELKAPSPTFKIDEKILKPILKWELMARLYAELDAKNFRAASKSDGKKRRHINVTKLEDANKAGTVESKNCTLWVTEGDSAMAFAVKALGNIPRGRDYIGLFPLKGKPLNVMNASQDQIYGNDEINTLKEVLGIKERVNYLDDENFNELRYGHFMILADSDDDGKHILGLILNLFHCKYPSLLARNYVMYLRTKIVEIKKGKRKIKFYTQHEYDLWKEQNPDYKTWKHSYFKGLGSSEDEDIAEEFKAPKIVTSVYDNLAPYTLQLAFDSRLSDKRKDWLANWVPDYSVEQLSVQPISSFINHEFIQFSITDLSRSIPRFMDGLKTSQRKILWGAMIKWGAKIGKQDSNKMKVSRFASQISDVCAYKYGEKSLEGAIVSMAQDFIGSNNLPYLCRHGQFGCVAPNTPILLWNGKIKKANKIEVGDELIGDDGQKRTVKHVVSGIDDMYKIEQIRGESYIVNSIHILTLIVTSHKSLYWKDSTKEWKLTYLDHSLKKVRTKTIRTNELNTKHKNHYNKSQISKEEGRLEMLEFMKTIPDDNIIDIPLNEYINLSETQKKFFYGFKNFNPIQWEKQAVPIDPYIFGAWLGDGDFCGRGFTTTDDEIVKRYCLWADTIGAQVIHRKNSSGTNNHFGIRRKGSGKLPAIGDPNHSCETCIGCQTANKRCSVCDWSFENFSNTQIKVTGYNVDGVKRDDLNPFKEILKEYDLHKNKYIPECYIKNDVQTRLALLAGFIDTDGTLRSHGKGKGYHFEIGQKGDIHGHLLETASYIASSLGFVCKIYKTGDGMHTLRISGKNLHIIPTIVPRKMVKPYNLSINPNISNITVKKMGKGKYCGWHIDGNERFLLGDFTVTHNTRSRSGKDASSSRYIYTKPEWWVPLVFRKEDKPLLNIVIDEGEEIEPVTFYPIIPMQLINGALGIGTGHSTFIPNYNPLDICYWLEAKILGCTLPEIKPWYREFDGEIEIKVKKPTPKTESEDEDFTETEEDSDDPDNVLTDRFTKRSMRTTGCFEITGNVRKKVIVKEIPVGRSIFKYKTFLDKLREEKKITRYDNHSTHDKPHFEIYGMKTATLRTLKLIKSYGLSNMVMLDNYNRPVKYKDESEILETFYHLRLECYGKRKEYIINNIGEKIKILNEKIRFILAVIKGHEIVKSNPKITQEQANQQEAILVMGRNKELIKEQMERMGFDNELLKKVTLYQCTAEEVQTAKEEINDLEQEKKIKEETRPEDFWLSDLKEFVKAYCKHYKCKYKSPKPMSTRLVN